MAELARNLRFAEKVLACFVEILRLHFFGQVDGFERDDSVDLRIAPQVNESHRAAADRLEQLVAAHRRGHRLALELRWQLEMRAANEPFRDVAKAAVDERNPVEQLGRVLVLAAGVELTSKII